jgi:cytochrome c
MYSRTLLRLIVIFATTAGVAETPLSAPTSPGLGSAIAADADTERFILPDGTGLPQGSGDVATGQSLYQRHCVACHGPEGAGGSNDTLAGGRGTLTSDAPLKTIGSYWPYATTLFDYVRRAMPYPNPGSLTDDQTYALTAYLLHINGILPANAELNPETLSLIEMPNQQGFIRNF